jgi:hypothetical protein
MVKSRRFYMKKKRNDFNITLRIPNRHKERIDLLRADPDFNLNGFVVQCLLAKVVQLYGEEIDLTDKNSIDGILR